MFICVLYGLDLTVGGLIDMSMSKLSLKELAKKIPGTVSFVRLMRALNKVAAEFVSRVYVSRLKHFFWREVHFDTLNAPLAVSNHTRENYLVYTSDKVIGKLLYCRGDFDFQKFERALCILNLETKNEVVLRNLVLFDIGANVGSIGIPAIKRGYVDHVIAFEPDPDNFRLLRINAILNGVDDRMECHQVALGAEYGVAELKRNESNHGDHRIRISTGRLDESEGDNASDFVKTEVRRVDDFLTDESDCILWIDVQGYEADVLAGAKTALRNVCPLILEFTPNDLTENGKMDQLVGYLTGSSYTRFFNLESPSPVSIDLNRDNILELGRMLEERDSFTDILVI